MLLLRLVRQYRRMRERKSLGLLAVLFLLAVSVLGNALCFHLFDGRRQGLGYGDAVWYSVISIATIGYGDYSASSAGARWGTFFFVIVLGLGTFSVFLGMAVDWVTDLNIKRRRGMGKILAKDHILIVNFPSAGRVDQLIRELRSDPQHNNREIVIISDRIESLPFADSNLLFVKGPILERQTYERAKADQARMAVVLATSYDDSSSDAVVASEVAVIDSINPDVHIVAECLSDRHRMLFSTVHCDAIVFTQTISNNLLVQEANDPVVAQLLEVITSNIRGTTLFSAQVTEPLLELTYNELAKRLLDRDVNLLCVNRDEESLTSFISLFPQAGDRVIYAGSGRISWPKLLETAGLSKPA